MTSLLIASHDALQTESILHSVSIGHWNPAHGSLMHIAPWQHTRPGLQPAAHWLTTHIEVPSCCTTHTCEVGHCTPVHGLFWHWPMMQTWSARQPAHGLEQVPVESQNWPCGQVTPKQGSLTHLGGVPA